MGIIKFKKAIRRSLSFILPIVFILSILPVTVAAGNVIAVNDSATVIKNSTANPINVLNNDSCTDGNLTITGVTQGAHGTVEIKNSGSNVTYTPAFDYSGSDSFSYTASDGKSGTGSATVSVTVTLMPISKNASEIYAPNNIELSILRYMNEHPYNVIEFGYGDAKYVEGDNEINLLMFNGGYVNCADVCIIDGVAYASARVLFEVIGAEYKGMGTGGTILIQYNGFEFRYFPKEGFISKGSPPISGENLGSGFISKMNMKTGERVSSLIIDQPYYIRNYEVYVPIRPLMEMLGMEVEFHQWVFATCSTVNTIIVDDNSYDKVYSKEEGCEIVRDAADEMYANMIESFKLGMEKGSNLPPEALEKVKSDAASFEVINTGEVYGRYYIYHIVGFEMSDIQQYDIYFNKYTGDIFGDAVYVLPFICISPGVVDLHQIYWYDWETLK